MLPQAEAAIPDLPLAPVPHRVCARRRESAGTWTIELEPAAARLPEFAPGQFAMLYAFGAGEVPVSMRGRDPVTRRLVHTIRSVGAVTRALCAAEPGRQIGVRGPYGAGWPLAQAEGADVVLVAGGLGLAPLRPVMEHVLASRERFGRLSLLYGGRTPGELLYRPQLERWRGRPDAAVQVTVDSAASDWRGRVGLVTALVASAAFDRDNAIAMVVGPEAMMRFTVAALLERGLAPERIHVSLERSMHCAIGHCGHCMLGPEFVCKDGPVFPLNRVARWLGVRRL
jgi:NAD(P)H-flavin reductase